MLMPRIEDLGRLVREERAKRGQSLRAAAADIDISFNVLARVERGHLPDIDNYQRILRWLGMTTTDFEETRPLVRPESTPDIIAHHLWLDPHLSNDARDRIATVVREMYSALARPPGQVAVHLRAARTFNPAAANLLADLLDEMRAGLLRQRQG
jgi:transcriptional regulator with XRE-family HTH domain